MSPEVPQIEPATPPVPEPRRVPFWGWQDVALLLGLGVPAFLIASLIVGLVARLFHLSPTDAVVQVVAQTAAYVALFALLASILRIIYDAPFWISLGWVHSRIGMASAIALGPLVAIAIAQIGGLLNVPDPDSPMKKILDSPHGMITLAIFGIAVAPLAEELLFRGFLQPLLVRSLGAVAGIVVTSFLFGSLHGAQNAWSWPIVALITLAGVAFGIIRHFGSTRSSMLTHVAYNTTLFVVLFSQGRNLKH